MTLIGITGAIGHGKSSLADALTAQMHTARHLESSTIIAEVADALHAQTSLVPDASDVTQVNEWLRALPAILRDVTHKSVVFDQIKLDATTFDPSAPAYEKLVLHLRNLKSMPELLSQLITSANKEDYRPILQWLGGYLVSNVDTGIWYNELVRRAMEAEGEGCELCVIGGLRFPGDAEIVRQAGGLIVSVVRPEYAQNDLLDPTERERVKIHPDTTIINNGTLQQLQEVARKMLLDLQQDTLDPQYNAR